MCGIFGYFDKNHKSLATDEIKKMGQAIRHRGPDDSGIFVGEGLSLGNQRLSIIDIEGGHQPFYSADEKIVVVQNGEIFNFVELRSDLIAQGLSFDTHSDTEVILRGYEFEGIEFVKKLNGMFAIAIYDKRKSLLYIVRDRIGVKPIYYGNNDGRLYFSSEVKSILSADSSFKELDRQAMAQYFQLGYIPPPLTLFKQIKQVRPGHYLEISQRGVVEKNWWKLSDVKIINKTEDERVREIGEVFSDAVAIRMRADVAFGAFLSGGIDSSFNVAHMVKNGKEKTQTFNISFPDTAFDEHPYALAVSKKFNTDHKTTEARKSLLELWPKFIYHCDLPHADVSFIPTYKVSEKAVETVKMVLSGDGADEIFAGYGKYLAFKNEWDKNNSIDVASEYLAKNSIYSQSELKELFVEQESGSLIDKFSEQLMGLDDWDAINQYLYLDTVNLLPGNNLVKPDRMGMAVSLEARPPFMDYRLVEMAFSIPGEQKLKNNETKYLLKKSAASILGEDVVYRKKQMFSVPITDWADLDLATVAEKLLLDTSTMALEYIRRDAIENCIQGYRKDPRQQLKKLRTLISFELWLRIVFNGQDYQSFESYFQ